MSSDLCPITYEPLKENENRYSKKGLQRLSPNLKSLEELPWNAETQRAQARRMASKISIQGVQPKLSARLNSAQGKFYLIETHGHYILKPQTNEFPELPENEDLTMRLASTVGIDIPLHGLVYSKGGSMTYFIRRFDRGPRKKKLHIEDFAQLAMASRLTKYNYSMEKLADLIDRYCTFPLVEKQKLFVRVIFNFLIGNEDMHLKNFSIIHRDGKIELSPGYDFLNTSLVIENREDEIALPIRGKRNKLHRADLIDYFGAERLKLNAKTIGANLELFRKEWPLWETTIKKSFLSSNLKEGYFQIVQERRQRLRLS